MEFKPTQHRIHQLASRLNLMVSLVFGLLLTNILTATLAWYTSLHQKTEITPFGSNEGYIKSQSYVDANYLSLMGINFMYSRLNITPENVNFHHKRLLGFIDSTAFATISGQLNREKQLIKSKNISSHFEIEDVRSDINKLKTSISGTLIRYVGIRKLKPEKLIYHINYRYRYGRLTIISFTHKRAHSKGEQHV